MGWILDISSLLSLFLVLYHYSILLPFSLFLTISMIVAPQGTPTSSKSPDPCPSHQAALCPLESLISFRSQDATYSSFSSLLLFSPAYCLSGSPKLKALLQPPDSRQTTPSVPKAFTHSWEGQGNAAQNSVLGEGLQILPSPRFWWQWHTQWMWQSR